MSDTLNIPKQSTPSSLRCRHIGAEDRRCGSPAMRGESFCYHHHQTRRPIENLRHRRARQSTFSVPAPNSRNDIQQALGTIIVRIAANDIDLRRAGLLLYALQIANSNLNHHQTNQPKSTTSPGKTKQAEGASAETQATQFNPASEQTHSVPEQSHFASEQANSASEQSHIVSEQSDLAFEQTHSGAERSHSAFEQSRAVPNQTLSALEQKCHPERSAAESKDLRFDLPPKPQSEDQQHSNRTHYGSGPTPNLAHPQTEIPNPNHDFTSPPPVWRSISKATGAALLDTLARREGAESAPASPDDRRPGPHPSEGVISTGAMDSSIIHGGAEKPIQPNDPINSTSQITEDERATVPDVTTMG
ncbi:MAG TPA: hypothetical protein VGG95_09530 [Edaphobacter sp.]